MIRSLILVLFMLLIFAENEEGTAQSPDSAPEAIAALNAHRLSLGLHPLSPNADLTAMARAQAEYLQSLNFSPPNNDFHVDAKGTYPRQRAGQYNWIPYGEEMQVGENAGLGSLKFVLDYWLGSNVHKSAWENPIYREVGVWKIPHRFGHLYIVVFGSRPNVFPTPFDPQSCRLYLPNEHFTRGRGSWIRSVEALRVFDAKGNLLGDALAGQTSWVLPPINDPNIQIEFSGSGSLVREVRNLQENIALLPSTLLGQSTCLTEGGNNTSPSTELVFANPVSESVSTNPSVTGKVAVGQGSSLTCRQYADSASQSLGLLPNETELVVIGLPEWASSNLSLNQLWLYVEWQSATCWINAGFFSTFYQNKSIASTVDYIALVESGILALIPANVPASP